HAKINLSLDVLSKREDGYHNLQMIMQTIQLHDTISIHEIPSGVEIKCAAPYVPNNSSNIAYKAAEAMINKFKLDAGVSIVIDKKIPVAAGLAGGSTDAAAVIRGINTLFKLGIEQNELMQIGKTIGADVPYCIMGGTVLAEGIGEKLTKLTQLGKIPIILIKPRIGVSTPWVYKSLNLDKVIERPNNEILISAMENRDIRFIAENMSNVLESVTLVKYPIIGKIKKNLIEKGALGSMMSGSGPTVFGIFEDEKKAKSAFNILRKSKHDCFLTYTI
ncbi:MAG: 4-(cytidine 5'-diphospho)-2-C-methyl-D-erythritol kinase, partial [Ruminiclostridium sp.]